MEIAIRIDRHERKALFLKKSNIENNTKANYGT
jgi:hypothetical protein